MAIKTTINVATGEVTTLTYEAPSTPDSMYWSKLRARRNQLIAETDYLALSDVTLSSDMTTYRQALRDLPANTTDPANPVWPTKPGGAS